MAGWIRHSPSSHKLRRDALGPACLGQEKALQPDSNQPPMIGTDHPSASSLEPEKPQQHKGVRAIVWIGALLFFAAGFVLVLRHTSTTAATGPGGGGGRRGGGAGGV